MADERSAKLKLKRKKVPGKAGLPLPTVLQAVRVPPLTPQNEKTFITSSCWFEGEGLNELHSVWKEVLNATYPDLKSRNWDSIPSFPEYPEQCSVKDARKTEVFKVGSKEFKWTDFPSLQETKVTSVIPEMQQVVAGSLDHLKVEVSHSKVMSLITEKSKIASNNPSQTIKANQNTQNILKISKKGKVEVPKQPRLKNQTQNPQKKGKMKISADIHSPSIGTAPQNLTKASCFKKLFKTNSQSEKKETEGALSHGKQNACIIVDDDISIVQDEHCPIDFPSEKVNEGTASLQSCPMCCLQFERFTPLEIDSHLAMCLSESTEDIMW